MAMLAKSREKVRVAPISLAGALERVSAATFCLPMMCRMSLVNSAIKDNCLLRLGLHESPDPEIANVKGLWSV